MASNFYQSESSRRRFFPLWIQTGRKPVRALKSEEAARAEKQMRGNEISDEADEEAHIQSRGYEMRKSDE